MLHIQLNEHQAENTVQANTLPLMPPDGVKRSKQFFLKKVTLQIKLERKTCRTLCKFDLMHTPDILDGVKGQTLELCR